MRQPASGDWLARKEARLAKLMTTAECDRLAWCQRYPSLAYLWRDEMSPEDRWARAWRLRKVRQLIGLLLLLRPPMGDDFVRAGGDVECFICGALYRDHVQDPRDPWLHCICDGHRVKL